MSTIDLRCEGTLHGRLTDDQWLEVKCDRRKCGHRKGVIVLHTINIRTGEVISTKRYAEPTNQQRRGRDASDHTPAAVRSA
jgi:hypothetical protein